MVESKLTHFKQKSKNLCLSGISSVIVKILTYSLAQQTDLNKEVGFNFRELSAFRELFILGVANVLTKNYGLAKFLLNLKRLVVSFFE